MHPVAWPRGVLACWRVVCVPTGVQCRAGAGPQPDPALGPLLLGWAWAEHNPTWGSLGAGPPRRWDLAGPPQSPGSYTVHSEGGGMGPPAALGQSLPLASLLVRAPPLLSPSPHPKPLRAHREAGTLPFISSTPEPTAVKHVSARGGFSQIEVPSRVPPRASLPLSLEWRRPRAAGSRGAAVWGCPAPAGPGGPTPMARAVGPGPGRRHGGRGGDG